MEFKSLYISRDSWHVPPIHGTVEFEDDKGGVRVILTEEHCQQMLSIVAGALVEQTEATVRDLRGAVINAATPQLTKKA